MPDILSALLGESVQPALEALDFVIFCSIPSRDDTEAASGDRVLVTPGLEWEKVDALLTDELRLPKLHALRIHYSIYDSHKGGILSSAGSTPFSCTLRQQTLAVLPKVKESSLVVAVGAGEAQREFNRIIEPVLDGAWTY